MSIFTQTQRAAGFCASQQAPRSLLGSLLTGPQAGDGDALPSASQGASLTLRHRLHLAIHFHTDANPFFLALRCFSADTFAALVWKNKQERFNGTSWRWECQSTLPPKSRCGDWSAIEAPAFSDGINYPLGKPVGPGKQVFCSTQNKRISRLVPSLLLVGPLRLVVLPNSALSCSRLLSM